VDTPVKPLVAEGLSKNFGGLQALDRVSISLEGGERRAVIGPNGAGKTTLFNLISGVLRPSSGRIRLFGKDVTRMSAHRRASLGLARTFQVTNLFPNLSLMENILLAFQALDASKFSLLRPASSYKHLFRQARELLEEWGLWEKADVLVKNLSYGDQRQAEVLMALAQKPKLLLLDEPTGGLSPGETSAMVSFIRNLPSDIAIILIEHDMDVAFELVDTVTVLHLGRVLADGPRDQVREDPRVQEIYLGQPAT
jgi:branched-chain amino acid transport system ATP-binding protein